MIVKEWDISLIDFVCKFCKGDRKFKIRFDCFDEELEDVVTKSIIIDKTTYIPDCTRDKLVAFIEVDDGCLVITLQKHLTRKEVADLKHYTFSN